MSTSPTNQRTHRVAALVVGVLVVVQALMVGSAAPARADSDGRSIKGGSNANDATEMKVGDWVDRLGPAGTDAGMKVFVIERSKTASGLSIAATIDPQPGVADGVEVKLSTGATICDSDRRESTESDRPLTLTALAEDSARSGGDEACLQAERLVVQVIRTQGTDERPVRLRFTRLPAVTDLAEWPEVDRPDSPPKLTITNPTSSTPGRWFTSAPLVDSGAAQAGTIGANQKVTYKVRMRWGQKVAWKVVFPEAPASVRQQIEQRKITAHVRLFNPQGGSTSAQEIWNLGTGSEVDGTTSAVTAYHSSERNNMQGQYTLLLQTVGDDGTAIDIPYQLVMQTYMVPDDTLGPDVSKDGPDGATPSLVRTLIAYGLIGLGSLLVVLGAVICFASRRMVRAQQAHQHPYH